VVPFAQVSPPKPCTQLSFICATCPAHLTFLVLMTWTVFGEEYRSLSSSLCSFLHSPVTSSLLGPNIIRSTLFSTIHSLRSSLNGTHMHYGFHYIRIVQLCAEVLQVINIAVTLKFSFITTLMEYITLRLLHYYRFCYRNWSISYCWCMNRGKLFKYYMRYDV